jgi:hypothetical protein
MTLPRRAYLTLSALTMVLLFGLLGLAWWGWRYRSGYRPSARKHRVLTGLAIVGLVFIAVGTAGRLAAVFQPASACTPSGGTQAPARTARVDASLVAQQVATWPETGIGLLYSHARDAKVCLSTAVDYYVGVHADNIAGSNAMTVGDIVLTPGFSISKEHLRRLIQHEAKHRVQWAIGTAIGGPFLFPVAYGIVQFFFPGSRNIFERQAGLYGGGYRHVGYGPVLGPAQLAALGVLVVLLVVALLGVRHRHSGSRSRSLDDAPDAPRAGPGPGTAGEPARDE